MSIYLHFRGLNCLVIFLGILPMRFWLMFMKFRLMNHGIWVKLHPILYHQCVIWADMLSYSCSWRFPSCKRWCFTPRFTLMGVTFETKEAMYRTNTWGPLVWSNENNISQSRYDWMSWVLNPISSCISSLEVQQPFLYRLVYGGLISSKRNHHFC